MFPALRVLGWKKTPFWHIFSFRHVYTNISEWPPGKMSLLFRPTSWFLTCNLLSLKLKKGKKRAFMCKLMPLICSTIFHKKKSAQRLKFYTSTGPVRDIFVDLLSVLIIKSLIGWKRKKERKKKKKNPYHIVRIKFWTSKISGPNLFYYKFISNCNWFRTTELCQSVCVCTVSCVRG